MRRVVVLGRGGAGKSTFARALGTATGLPVIELDRHFWSADLRPLSSAAWATRQGELAAADSWIMDGDLGSYDVPAPRLARADTVVVLDLSLPRCAWRAIRRERERWDFWRWLITWRVSSRPGLLRAIETHAPRADVHVLRSPRQIRAFTPK